MKKIITLLFVFILSFSVFASNLVFTPVSYKPLYKGYKADMYSFDTQGQYFRFLKGGLDSILVQSKYEADMEAKYLNFDKVQGEYKEEFVMELASFINDPAKGLLRLKPGVTLSALRVEYKGFSADAFLQIGLNTMLNSEHGTDLIGYDGMYCYGVEASYKDIVQIKLGKHHFSGHYGDEVLDSMLDNKDSKGRKYSDRKAMSPYDGGYIAKETEYVRQDSLIIGVSVSPFKMLRVYGEADLILPKMDTLRPWVLIPDGVTSTVDKENMVGRIGNSEKIFEDSKEQRRYPYSDKYKAMIFNAGAEFSYLFENYGELSLAYNIRLNQEGQTMYQFNCYKEDNKWDIDHTVALTFKIQNSPVGVQVIYHNGRIPLLNYFYCRSSFITAGFTVEL